MKAKQFVIVLHLSRVVALFLIFCRHVVQAMTNNAWFPSPSPTLSLVTTHLDNLQASQARALTRAEGAAAARDLDLKKAVDDMTGLKAHVLGVILQNPSQAALIAESAGMQLKKTGGRKKPYLSALMGPSPGEVLVRAKAVKGAGAYEWMYSLDGGKTWLAMGTSTVAEHSVTGLAVGPVLFRFRTTKKNTTGDWSQTLAFNVH
jgi:hypothetical protein